jgi:predicted nucleic acid-binding Zn ribbon protein
MDSIMSQRPHRDENEEEDDWDDEEDFGEEDPDSEDATTMPCPQCGADLYDDAEFCARCENYISQEDAPSESRPIWIWIMLLISLGIAVYWVI